ncbi:MAG: LysM peptidoglycan-binding domain-containing M23 family metallopeptidase [Candidatus Omnitrophica bacterium]|nr:LysM peptidoglycan-binding domain-containing M23 family metallopeptidase [Candidatus Omnitrophota bacterium]
MLKTVFIFLLPLLTLLGCASAPLITPVKMDPGMPGIYHRVEKSQTLWRISKIYNLDIDELINVNRLPDATKLEVGQLIFIPQRRQAQASYSYSGSEDFIWPLKGRVITGFGANSDNTINKGLNIQPRSSSAVLASRSGKVVFRSQDFMSYGKTIIIEHVDGFSTVYARNTELLANLGDQVQKGQAIAKIDSGYLHFEIRKGYSAQNPYFYLP